MKLYLAGSGWIFLWDNKKFYNFNRLESFGYIDKKEFPLIKLYNNFILDSGAFTYLNNSKESIDWEKYIDSYANFIVKYNVDKFIELDIDSVVGLKEVERLRNQLEKKVGRKCMPVWHKSRGKDYWIRMCKEYDYIAIGGIVTKEIKSTEYKYFHYLIKIAHENNCKVHGLGFTNLKGLKEYNFDSVDSTSWLSGNRFGSIYKFNGETMLKFDKKLGQRVITHKTAMNNFEEWVKFANYMEKNDIIR